MLTYYLSERLQDRIDKSVNSTRVDSLQYLLKYRKIYKKKAAHIHWIFAKNTFLRNPAKKEGSR